MKLRRISNITRQLRPSGHKSPAFCVRHTSLLDRKITIQTTTRDKVLSAMLRGEMPLCKHYTAELRWLADQLTPETVLFEAGGNIGSVAIALALAEPRMTVVSFEPDKLNYALFQVNLELNNVRNVQAFNLALGNRNGMIEMFTSPDNFGDHRTSKPIGLSLREDEFERAPSFIPVAKGSEFIGQLGLKAKPNLVKIDTQGADIEILNEIKDALAPDAKVATEFSPYHLRTNGSTIEDVESALSGFAGFQIIEPDGRGGYKLKDYSMERLKDYFREGCESYKGYFDLIATR